MVRDNLSFSTLQLTISYYSDAMETLAQLKNYEFSNTYMTDGLEALLEFTMQQATEVYVACSRFSAYRTAGLHDAALKYWRGYRNDPSDPGRPTNNSFFLLDTPGFWPTSSSLSWLELRNDVCQHAKEVFNGVLKLLETIVNESGSPATEEMEEMMEVVKKTLERLYDVGVASLVRRVDLMRFYTLAAAEMRPLPPNNKCFTPGSADAFGVRLGCNEFENEDL